jgi:hypothetical protein
VAEVMEDWIEAAKRVLIQIQLVDNLEKTLVIRILDIEWQVLISAG